MIELLPLGVDTDTFRYSESARLRVRARLGIPPYALVVLQSGKLGPEKGPHILSEAMAELMVDDGDIWLVFVGAGPDSYLQRVKEPLIEAGVSDRLLVHPMVEVPELPSMFRLLTAILPLCRIAAGFLTPTRHRVTGVQ